MLCVSLGCLRIVCVIVVVFVCVVFSCLCWYVFGFFCIIDFIRMMCVVGVFACLFVCLCVLVLLNVC